MPNSQTASLARITLTRPDDWHLHLRDGDALKSVLPHSAAQFARAIVMPNLRPPVTTVAAAGALARARSHLEYEQEQYRLALQHGRSYQLSVPLASSG